MADNDTNITSTEGGSSGEPSLRDDLAAALEQVEARDAPPEPKPDAAPAPADAPRPDPAAAPGERGRDPATGRFTAAPDGAPKPAAKPLADAPKPDAAPVAKAPAPAPAKPQEPPKPDAAAPAPTRAPVSWKPAAREHWAKLPPEVQQEVIRRESEVARTMSESHKAREALTHVQQTLAPFVHNINAIGGNPLDAMQQLFTADNVLRHGNVGQKAAMIADIIKNYGVDITALDAVLAGQPLKDDPNAALADRLRKEMQATLQPVLGYFNKIQGARQAQINQIN